MRVFLLILSVCTLAAWSAGAVNNSLLMSKKPAKKLSEYNLFEDPAAQIPSAGLIRYDLNNPLFTDYALKIRYLYVPGGAGAAVYQEQAVLDFPIGSVLVKTFAYPKTFDEPTKDVRFIETRLLVRKAEGWKAYPYIWNEDQSEAILKVAGGRMQIPVIWRGGHSGKIDYLVPNMNQCKGCHTNANKVLTPIGPKVRNLNRLTYEGNLNQITVLQNAGYLSGVPKDFTEIPKTPDPFDVDSGSLLERGRAYLDGNCAHCHSAGHPADTSGLYLNYEEERSIHWGVNKPPVAAGRGAGGLRVDIEPGSPEQSILLYRMDSIDPGVMMPELGRSTIHKEGVELIRDFIRSLD